MIGTLVKFSFDTQVLMQNPDEVIRLAFLGYTGNMQTCDGFEIIPQEGRGNFTFEIRVADSTILDYETLTLVKLKVG